MSGRFLQRVLAYKPAPDWQINTHVSLKHQYVYLQVCKAASSTIVQHLQEKELADCHWSVTDHHNKRLSPLLSPYQLPDDILDAAMTSSSWRRVTFVRNPFDRLLSCYLHRIVAEPDSASARHYRRSTNDTDTPSFGRFVEVVCNQTSAEMERHWRVQADEVLTDLVDLDFVGKVERLDGDLSGLWRLLFGSTADDISTLADVNASPMMTNARKRRMEYYDDALVEQVTSRFAKDFDRFEYPTQPDDS